MMPVLVGFTAFAVDLGAIQLDNRRLQGIADAAALAAATLPSEAEARANHVVSGSGFPRPVSVTLVQRGKYALDPAVAPALRFSSAATTTPNAVRVVVQSSTPTFFARIFGTQEVAIARQATARRQHYAAFSIGSRLASVNGGILNAYLGALTGSELKLSVADYHALAGAQVDLLGMLPLLRTAANLTAASYSDILATQVALPTVLNALSQSLAGSGQTGAANAVKLIANVSSGQTVKLSALIDPGPMGGQQSGGASMAKVDALSLLTAMLQLGGKQRQVSLDLGASVLGLASTKLVVAVGERPQQSPWITITDSGAPIVRTAQARVYLRTTLLPVSLPGLGSLVSINLPILLELASAHGRLSSIDCPGSGVRSVSLEGKTDIGSATIGTVDESQISNFSTTLHPASAKLVDVSLGILLPIVSLTTNTRISLGAAEQWQKLKFSETEITNGTRKTIAGSVPVGSIASSLTNQATITPSLLGLQLPLLNSLVQAVGEVLKPVGALLDPLLMTVTGTLGVGLGEADLQVTGMRCGQATLVA